MKHRKSAVHLLIAVLGLWLLWSGPYSFPGLAEEGSALVLGLGILSALGVVLLCDRMGIVDHDIVPLDLTLPTLRYVPWLTREVIRSNIDVILRILRLGRSIDPKVVKVRASQRTDLGKVTYANSITLTPGTVTVEAPGDAPFVVHALTREAGQDVLAGDMHDRCVWVEGQAFPPRVSSGDEVTSDPAAIEPATDTRREDTTPKGGDA